MDGSQKRLTASIQLRLSFSLSSAIIIVAVMAGIFSFVSAFDEAYALQDDMLKQIAALFDLQHLPLPHLDDAGRAKGSSEESRVIVQYLSVAKNIGTGDQAGQPLALPPTLPDGLHTIELDDEAYRVLVKSTSNGERIAVAQETGIRDEIARGSGLRTAMPFLILVPILLFIVARLVRTMFKPIAALATEIDERDEHEQHPVEITHLPLEVRPFAVAINRLLGRVAQSMEIQRRFVADAAHELRSPMTALSLQAERLADAAMPAPARERLATLQRGIERGRILLDQLLTLAKAQTATERQVSAISVHQTFRHVLEDLMPLAEARRIDIGMAPESDATVLINPLDLETMIRNLVDNAIRYTPDGGRVDLSVATVGARALLEVRDSGPGIDIEERGRIFDPFYRTLGTDQAGSGLGLSIVKAIADRIGAEIRLGCADEATASGLRVTLLIPVAPSSNCVQMIDNF